MATNYLTPAEEYINQRDSKVRATPLYTPHPDVLPLKPEEVDELISEYETLKTAAEDAKQDLDECKERIIFMVDNFGQRPAHTEQSIRLDGLRNSATVTRGSTVLVDESAVLDLALNVTDVPGLFARLFAAQTRHTLVEGARDVLKTIRLPRRRHEKVLALFGKCIDIKTKSPSLKIEVIKAEKPAKQPRVGKAVA